MFFRGRDEDEALEMELDGLLRDAAQDRAERSQHAFDAIFPTHAGRPPAEVRDALAVFAEDGGWRWVEADLAAAAEAISEGTRLEFRAEEG